MGPVSSVARHAVIPKASQRGLGQDLATHLQNAHDNEYVEVAELRGAVARDLHGAFAEWEVQAATLTRCKRYLYSLSVNPDPGQGPLTRAQYLEYLDRAERQLGLAGQPRAVVFHIKEGREHCHVVWSRIDAANGRAIHQPFDRQTLMLVTRAFAREHGLELPAGMDREREGRSPKLSLYETQQERATGVTKEERMAQVTAAWRRHTSAKAFVRALEELGYVLATGKRPYVLIDSYGQMNALAKLIDDKAVRTKDVRARLERDFPPESLPTVDEAKKLVKARRKAIEEFQKAQVKGDRIDALERMQAGRRAEFERKSEAANAGQRRERAALDGGHLAVRRLLKQAYLAESRRVRLERYARQPKGLAGFLARISGVTAIRRKLHKFKDKERLRAFEQDTAELRDRQRDERAALQRRHEAQGLDLGRERRGLDKVEQRELKALQTAHLKQERVRERRRHEHIPAPGLDLQPRGRRAVPDKAKNRFTGAGQPSGAEPRRKDPLAPGELTAAFSRAAADKETGGRGAGSDGSGLQPSPRSATSRRKRHVETGRER